MNSPSNFAPPRLERFFDRPYTRHRYKHTFEPFATYRYVTGVHDFADFIRFDSNATLTNTNEIEYGITQHLYIKSGDDQPVDFLSWNIVQKHYFDSTFGGAIIDRPAQRLHALDSVTAFAFASSPRNWSPIISDVKLTPGGLYDAEQIIEYDPQLRRSPPSARCSKLRPYSERFFTVAHFRLQGDPIVQPLPQQIRAIMGYGDITRKASTPPAG